MANANDLHGWAAAVRKLDPSVRNDGKKMAGEWKALDAYAQVWLPQHILMVCLEGEIVITNRPYDTLYLLRSETHLNKVCTVLPVVDARWIEGLHQVTCLVASGKINEPHTIAIQLACPDQISFESMAIGF